MDLQRRRRRDEEPDERRATAPQRDQAEGSDAESLLDLQRRAGNLAVTELLGVQTADAGRPTVQRDPTDATPTAAPTDQGPAPGVGTMSVPELKLGVPVQSVQRSGRGPGGREGDKESTAGEVTVTLSAEHLDSRLWEAAAKGRQFGTITITIGPTTITLHGVVISGVNVGGDTASLTLNFSSMEFDPGARGDSQEPPPAYDLGK